MVWKIGPMPFDELGFFMFFPQNDGKLHQFFSYETQACKSVSASVSVCLCVRERQRERDKETERENVYARGGRERQ